MKRLLEALDHAPLYWFAVGLGLLVFGLNQVLLTGRWESTLTEQGLLDQAFMQTLGAQEGAYELVPGSPQTFGAHVLPQYSRVALAKVTGDTDRAGIWLSLVGALATISGLYVLAIRIHPYRGFAVATVMASGALIPLHTAISPDPSVALGMALTVWGMALFLTSLTKSAPHDVFISALLFGLAGYIRIELSLVWVVLAVYLVLLQVLHAPSRKHEAAAMSMALGGLLMVMLVLWPMMHRNVSLSGTPVLPGYDAELILGAPVEVGGQVTTGIAERLLGGLAHLTVGSQGPGIFVGLLWPLGMVICLFLGRHNKIPYFWIPVLVGVLGAMTALSLVTGLESYHQTLTILTPMLFPFAMLPLAFVLEQWMERNPQPISMGRKAWAGAAVVFLMLTQLPGLFHRTDRDTVRTTRNRNLVEDVSRIPPRVREQAMVSDQPGPLVSAGKHNVIGTRGQTDWSILTTATAHGGFEAKALLAYLRDREVGLIHLSDPEDPLVDQLALVEGAPRFSRLDLVRPPHRVFRISWP